MVECELLSEFVNFYGNYCFNRYMVECEFIKFTNIARIGNVLIDTWWNVNECQYNKGRNINGF